MFFCKDLQVCACYCAVMYCFIYESLCAFVWVLHPQMCLFLLVCLSVCTLMCVFTRCLLHALQCRCLTGFWSAACVCLHTNVSVFVCCSCVRRACNKSSEGLLQADTFKMQMVEAAIFSSRLYALMYSDQLCWRERLCLWQLSSCSYKV